jgi:dTDP-glucose 4,6-dehydratase
MKTILITGGAGFIGSHVVREFVLNYPETKIINLDALTYAGNLENLKDIQNQPNYTFVRADITDAKHILEVFEKYQPDGVIHLAAESHVDRSITNPLDFVMTNVIGTVNLLNAAKKIWKDNFEGKRFHHVSTDEVFGALGDEGFFTEETSYDPHSPYSASKASSDHFVRAYHDTYGLPIVMTNCSNNYGPNHFPEKLIPLCIHNILNGNPLPIYGDGKNVRDWLYVLDHCKGIELAFKSGKAGETYNIGGRNERNNLYIVDTVCSILNELQPKSEGKYQDQITFVKDRPGHDLRYAIDATKIETELGWKADENFETGIVKTVRWYLEKFKNK